jgi:hypothetical protein
MNAQPQRPMQSLFPWFGAAFALASLGAIFTSEYTLGGAFLGVAALFILFWREARVWVEIPQWKRLLMMGLLLLSAVLLIIAFVASFI